uniref:MoeA C-terminal domain-containing protein n=1 Tax=Arundo donax TaxID=35708 RepID=A0A0A9H3K2_ARUDO
MIATSAPFGSRIMSPITRGKGIVSTTHDGEASVILIRPHVASAGTKVPLFFAEL